VRLVRFLVFFCHAVVCFAQLDVFYAGRTLGYFRHPDRQSLSMNSCGWEGKPMNDAVIGFENVWKNLRAPNSLLVGMGDNFAPQLEARTFETDKIPFQGKDLFVWNGAKRLYKEVTEPRPYDPPIDVIPADNVGCFILKMGYAALVPGKHDFYFGPDYLRMMAKFLYQDPTTGTALLAANLSISTTAPDAKPRQPLYMIEHDLNAHGKRAYSVLPPIYKDDPSPSITFPDVVMPWYRKVAVDNAFYLTEKDSQTRVNPADLTLARTPVRSGNC